MVNKDRFLQIRASARQKEQLRRNARAAGMDVSAWVLSRAIPEARLQFETIIRALKHGGADTFQLATLNDLLTRLPAPEFQDGVAAADLSGLSSFHANYVTAMVELAASLKGVAVPDWASEVPPLDAPWFATTLPSLRQHLLNSSPVPFKRRNLFIDSSIGSRV
jgi:hypothetical protein